MFPFEYVIRIVIDVVAFQESQVYPRLKPGAIFLRPLRDVDTGAGNMTRGGFTLNGGTVRIHHLRANFSTGPDTRALGIPG